FMEYGVMADGAIVVDAQASAEAHDVWHVNGQHGIALDQQFVDRPLHPVPAVHRPGLIVKRGRMPMVQDHQALVRPFWNEMMGVALLISLHGDRQGVHAREAAQAAHRAGVVLFHHGQFAGGHAGRAEDKVDELLAFLGSVLRRGNSDLAVVMKPWVLRMAEWHNQHSGQKRNSPAKDRGVNHGHRSSKRSTKTTPGQSWFASRRRTNTLSSWL